ncbi:hypothetical protein Bca4012_068321 [Brassica carinata]
MESGYEFDSFSELPPLPQVYHPIEYSTSYPYSDAIAPLESLPPFPYSDFTTYGGGFAFSDQQGSDSSLSLLNNDLLTESTRLEKLFSLDSSLSLPTRDLLTESTQSEKLFSRVDVAPTPFLHLPDLQSIEHSTAAEVTKSPRLSLAPPLPVTTKHDADVKRRRLGNNFAVSPSSSSKSRSPTRYSSSYGVSSSRRKITEKIRSLEKLMPWETKMNLATILEETRKYIAFLQSQIASLRWMPLESVYPAKPGVEVRETTNPLVSLTRQQILQVIANSPGSRNVLYSRGVCVFSYEQLLSVKMMAESTRNL